MSTEPSFEFHKYRGCLLVLDTSVWNANSEIKLDFKDKHLVFGLKLVIRIERKRRGVDGVSWF